MGKKHYSGKHYPSELDKVVMEELDSFYNLCVEDIQEASNNAAKWAAKELRKTSPVGKSWRTGGEYAARWKVDRKKMRTGARTIVYNDGMYMLTHLLEHGHPLPQGGRAQAKIHIKPVEEEANRRFEEELKRRIESDA